MNLQEAERFVYDEVGKYTYKPDNVIECWPIRTDDDVTMVEVGLRRFVQDSTGKTDKPLVFGQSKTIMLYAITNSKHAKEYIQWTVQALCRDAEMHELDEWLKYDGAVVRDPHKETA